MKKSFKILNIFLITLIVFSSLCFATSENDQNTVVTTENLNQDVMSISEDVPVNNEVNSDVFITQENVLVDERVNGSLFLIGDNVKVSSPEVNGNVFVIGNEIEITGKINGSVYAISTDVEISGETEDLYLITNDLEILRQASCRDVKVIGNSVEVEGLVNRDLYAISNEVDIKNTENSKVNGVLYATGNVIGRTDKINEISKMDIRIEKNDVFLNAFAKIVRTIYFISTAIMAFAIIAVIVLCTKKNEVYRSDVKEMFFKDALHGLVCWLICILIVMALALTIIGIPLAMLFAGIIWLLFWKINLPVASIELSKFALKNNSTSKWMIFFVAFLIFLGIQIIDLVPVLGGLVKYIISLYGFGFMYRKIFKRDKESKIEVEIVEEK